jgi:hypothetical protein
MKSFIISLPHWVAWLCGVVLHNKLLQILGGTWDFFHVETHTNILPSAEPTA